MFTHDEAKYNHLLASLPTSDFDHIRTVLERVSLKAGQVLHESADKFEYVYFPTTALITLLYPTESGMTVEVGMIGNDGVLGLEIFTGGDSSPSMAIVQNAGVAYRMRAGAFRTECAPTRSCQDSLLRYMQALISQVSQTAVCNRFHSIKQRFARWLLESRDRLDETRLAVTHAQIAGLLGVRRESITTAARELSVAGLIKVERGTITILDRPGLEFVACECYTALSAECNRLLGQGTSRTFEEAQSGFAAMQCSHGSARPLTATIQKTEPVRLSGHRATTEVLAQRTCQC